MELRCNPIRKVNRCPPLIGKDSKEVLKSVEAGIYSLTGEALDEVSEARKIYYVKFLLMTIIKDQLLRNVLTTPG